MAGYPDTAAVRHHTSSAPREVPLVRQPDPESHTGFERMGTMWLSSDNLVLQQAMPDTPAERAGLGAYVGWRLTHVNGQEVGSTNAVVSAAGQESRLLLRFEPPVSRPAAPLAADREPCPRAPAAAGAGRGRGRHEPPPAAALAAAVSVPPAAQRASGGRGRGGQQPQQAAAAALPPPGTRLQFRPPGKSTLLSGVVTGGQPGKLTVHTKELGALELPSAHPYEILPPESASSPTPPLPPAGVKFPPPAVDVPPPGAAGEPQRMSPRSVDGTVSSVAASVEPDPGLAASFADILGSATEFSCERDDAARAAEAVPSAPPPPTAPPPQPSSVAVSPRAQPAPAPAAPGTTDHIAFSPPIATPSDDARHQHAPAPQHAPPPAPPPQLPAGEPPTPPARPAHEADGAAQGREPAARLEYSASCQERPAPLRPAAAAAATGRSCPATPQKAAAESAAPAGRQGSGKERPLSPRDSPDAQAPLPPPAADSPASTVWRPDRTAAEPATTPKVRPGCKTPSMQPSPSSSRRKQLTPDLSGDRAGLLRQEAELLHALEAVRRARKASPSASRPSPDIRRSHSEQHPWSPPGSPKRRADNSSAFPTGTLRRRSGTGPRLSTAKSATPAVERNRKGKAADHPSVLLWRRFERHLRAEGCSPADIECATGDEVAALAEGSFAFTPLDAMRLRTLWLRRRAAQAQPPPRLSPPSLGPVGAGPATVAHAPRRPQQGAGAAPGSEASSALGADVLRLPASPPRRRRRQPAADAENALDGRAHPVDRSSLTFSAISAAVAQTVTDEEGRIPRVKSVTKLCCSPAVQARFRAAQGALPPSLQRPTVCYLSGAAAHPGLPVGDLTSRGGLASLAHRLGSLTLTGAAVVRSNAPRRLVLCHALLGRRRADVSDCSPSETCTVAPSAADPRLQTYVFTDTDYVLPRFIVELLPAATAEAHTPPSAAAPPAEAAALRALPRSPTPLRSAELSPSSITTLSSDPCPQTRDLDGTPSALPHYPSPTVGLTEHEVAALRDLAPRLDAHRNAVMRGLELAHGEADQLGREERTLETRCAEARWRAEHQVASRGASLSAQEAAVLASLAEEVADGRRYIAQRRARLQARRAALEEAQQRIAALSRAVDSAAADGPAPAGISSDVAALLALMGRVRDSSPPTAAADGVVDTGAPQLPRSPSGMSPQQEGGGWCLLEDNPTGAPPVPPPSWAQRLCGSGAGAAVWAAPLPCRECEWALRVVRAGAGVSAGVAVRTWWRDGLAETDEFVATVPLRSTERSCDFTLRICGGQLEVDGAGGDATLPLPPIVAAASPEELLAVIVFDDGVEAAMLLPPAPLEG